MAEQKYEFTPVAKAPGVVNAACLKEGESGVIQRVDFYRDGDYLRCLQKNGQNHDIGLDSSFVQKALNTLPLERLVLLEKLTDEQLAILSAKGFDMYVRLPHDELVMIRELEIELRKTFGEYRDVAQLYEL